jgi:hypothetical protein
LNQHPVHGIVLEQVSCEKEKVYTMALCSFNDTSACRQALLTNTRTGITQHSRFHTNLPVRRVKKPHFSPPKETGNKVSPLNIDKFYLLLSLPPNSWFVVIKYFLWVTSLLFTYSPAMVN